MKLFKSQMHICESLKRVDVWDALDSSDQPINGPVVKCEDCGREFHMTWENWEKCIVQGKAVVGQTSPAY